MSNLIYSPNSLFPAPIQSATGAPPVQQQPMIPQQQMQQPSFAQRFSNALPTILQGLGYGIAAGDLSKGAAAMPLLARDRNEMLLKQQEYAKEQQQSNFTKQWLKAKGREDLLPLVDAGQANEALRLATQQPDKPTPYTDQAKAAADLRAGLISPQQYKQMMAGVGSADYKTESDLRTEYGKTDTVKNYGIIRDYYERIQTGVTAGTGAGDIAAVFSYMKMLDPASTVREGEYATAQNAGGIAEGVRGLYNQLIGGGSLGGKARQQLAAQATKIYEDTTKNLQDQNKRYGDIAQQWRVDPNRVLVQPEQYEPVQVPPTPGTVGEEQPMPPPQPGQIIDGWRFKGGDPADPASWERAA